jgi:hypothetical protein
MSVVNYLTIKVNLRMNMIKLMLKISKNSWIKKIHNPLIQNNIDLCYWIFIWTHNRTIMNNEFNHSY